MQRSLIFVGAAVLLLVVSIFSYSDSFSADVVREPVPDRIDVVEREPAAVSAGAYYVFDVETGEELYEYKASTSLPIASITKLVSAAAFYSEGDLTATTSLTWGDLEGYGDAGRLSYGEVYAHHELLFPLLLESSNDAARTMARAGDSLLAASEALLEEVGVEGVIVDASGISLQNKASARAVGQLARHIYYTTPHIFDITILVSYYMRDTGWLNNNPFILDPSYRGGKHGYLPAAGRTTVSFFSEALPGGDEQLLGYVLLGSNDLALDMEILREYVLTAAAYD